jgi:hypothetical protein
MFSALDAHDFGSLRTRPEFELVSGKRNGFGIEVNIDR